MRWFLLALAACGSAASPPVAPTPAAGDPKGPHAAAVAAQVQPYLDGELVRSVVVGLYEGGKREVYGFGVGATPGAPPDGNTLFEIGSVTKVFTGLLLADAVQRKEVTLDMPLADLMPPGVTVPGRDKQVITLQQVAMHASGLPRLPPRISPLAPDPYAAYGENELYRDLVGMQLDEAPGTTIRYSNFGYGALGFALSRKLGGNLGDVLARRVFEPLGMKSTYVSGSGALAASKVDIAKAPLGRRQKGSTDDLADAAPWRFDALAGAGAMVSTVNDLLTFVDAEIDADAGGRRPLRGAMRFTQETQLEDINAPNAGIGWQIDEKGRYWHNGATGGFRSFVMFSPRTKRGVVVLVGTATPIADRIALHLLAELDNEPRPPSVFPTAAQMQPFVGTYDLAGEKVKVSLEGKRLYVDTPTSARTRLIPVSPIQFLITEIESPVIFEREGDKVARMIILVGTGRMVAPKIE